MTDLIPFGLVMTDVIFLAILILYSLVMKEIEQSRAETRALFESICKAIEGKR